MIHFAKSSYARVAAVVLVLAMLAMVAVPVALADHQTRRPIQEFVDAQGTYCWDDGAGGCLLFVPPIANFIGWTDPARDRGAAVDYAGLANDYIVDNGGNSLGTSTTGTVIERPRSDGRADVEVTLRTKKALVWVADDLSSGFNGPLLFGYRAPEVLAGKKPALCNSTFVLEFINTAPGVPLPDLIQLFNFPEAGQELVHVEFRCKAEGRLRAAFGVPEGTPGRVNVNQIGGPAGWPKEDVLLRVVK